MIIIYFAYRNTVIAVAMGTEPNGKAHIKFAVLSSLVFSFFRFVGHCQHPFTAVLFFESIIFISEFSGRFLANKSSAASSKSCSFVDII